MVTFGEAKENISPTVRPRRAPRLFDDFLTYVPSPPNNNTDICEVLSPMRSKRKRQDDEGSRKRSAGESENVSEDIIEVGDSDEEESPEKLSHRRTTRSSDVLSDTFKMCMYPENAKDSVLVCVSDYKSLEHDTYLNDIIIDFYLTYLYHKLTLEEQKKVHIFSTMFYKRLTSNLSSKGKEDANLSSAEKKHARVKGWTKNVDIFEKDFIFVPICESSHWYLLVVIRLVFCLIVLDYKSYCLIFFLQAQICPPLSNDRRQGRGTHGDGAGQSRW